MSELIHQFGVDWRLVVAQAVNFGILFFLLQRFAYGPILRILEERRQKIREGILMREEAERKLKESDQERRSLLIKTEKESLALLAKAESLGKEKEANIVSDAMSKGAEVLAEARRRAEEEKRIALEEFSREAAGIVREAVIRVAALSPEKIDEELLKKALREVEKTTS